MAPKELYNFISSVFSGHEVPSICYVEKKCLNKGFCANPQSTPVLDFDKIKDNFYCGLNVQTPASVDAITTGSQGSVFCFIELKGWQNYIDHQKQQRKTVIETVEGYNLSGKLADSQNLCIKLTNDPDLFAHMPVRFVLVTDIGPQTHGIEYIHSMFNALGETSTEIYSQCISESKRVLDSEIHIDKIYVQCRELDSMLQSF